MRCKGSTRTLESAVRDFILDRQISGCAQTTTDAYRWQLEPFVRWSRERNLVLDTLSSEHLKEFLAHRSAAGMPTLHHATVRLKTFFRWCAEHDVCDDLAARVQKPRQQRPIIEALGVEELRTILSLCRGNGFIPRRDEALIRFLLDTAARISEVLDLTIERLDLEAGRALLNGKGHKQRYVFFGVKTTRAVMRYLAWRERKAVRARAVFLNSDGTAMNRRHAHQTIARLGRRASIRDKRCSPHTLRHTAAVFFLRRGGDALSLQRVLGHSTLAMTTRYVASASLADVEAAHRRASPGDAV